MPEWLYNAAPVLMVLLGVASVILACVLEAAGLGTGADVFGVGGVLCVILGANVMIGRMRG